MLYHLVTHPCFQLFYLCDYEVFDLFEYNPSKCKNLAGRLFELFGLKPRLAKLSCWGNGGRCFWDLLSHNTMQNDPWKIAHLASHQIRNASGRLWLRIMTQFEAPRFSDDRWFGLRETLPGNHAFFMLFDVFPRFFPGKFSHLTPEISTHLLLTPQLCQSLTFFHAPATTTCTPASNRTGGNRWFLSSAQSSKFYVSGLQ